MRALMETTAEEAKMYCVECGAAFPTDQMIRHGNLYVCAACKPRFIQKLAEGASVHIGLRYAGFWRRFGAVLLDAIVLAIVNTVLQVIAVFLLGGFPASFEGTGAPVALTFVLLGIQFAVALSYETFMVGKYGATLGKMACKIHVVTPDGKPVSYLRAFGRYFAKILSWMILGIGYFMAAFDDERRALHDRLCNTRVVHS
jgi:uncharacterized RDD family membrane protein YckC